MRFFSGSRGGDKKKGTASEMFRKQMFQKDGPPETQEDRYKAMVESRLNKIREEYLMGKKKQVAVLGSKVKQDETPQEPSKRAKEMMQVLAMRKAKKDMKALKKRTIEWKREVKAKKAVIEAEKLRQQMADELLKQQEAEAAAALLYQQQLAAQKSDEGSGWW
jgi:hypothetical protein